MNRYLAIACLICFSVLIACQKNLTDDELTSLQSYASNELEVVTDILQYEGIAAAIHYCSEMEEIQTQAGTVEIGRSLTAYFYDPKDTVVTEGSNTILPVSIYTRVEDGLYLLDQGYNFRNVEISVFCKIKGRTEPLISINKKLGSS